MRAHENNRMVLQIAADAGQIGHHLDTERAQLRRRADAGTQQEGRRVNGAGANNDFVALDIAAGAVSDHRNAGRAPPVE